MAIPNTTPTPNELYNGEMRKMNDTELRVVLIVTRATLGWEINHETGMRKQEDWISHSQLIEKSGRSSRAISSAVDNCVKSGWIETRTQEGEILDTAEKRKKHGAKIYYRLGKIFLDKIETIATDAKVEPSQSTTETIATNDTKPSQKVRTTKEIHTKENIQKSEQSSPISLLRNYFIEKCKAIKGFEPEMSFGKEGKLLKEKLKRFSQDQIKDLIDKFFNSKIGNDLGYTLSICLSAPTINQWLAGNLEKAKKPFYRGNPMIKMQGKWFVQENGEKLEFAGKEAEIEWK